MAKRYQKGSLQRKKRGDRLVWLAFWYDTAGQRHSKTLGTIADMNKAEAQAALNNLVSPVNERRHLTEYTFGTFVPEVFKWKRRHWKASTRMSTEDRINRHLVPAFRTTRLSSLTREQLQDFLDNRANDGLAWSIVAHLRWDLRLICKFAVSEGLINKNPAELLYIPKAPSKERHVLTIDQASTVFTAFPLRERLILKLCGLAGLRPGEALALQWGDLTPQGLRITRRVYRGIIDSPKSNKGNRVAALSDTINDELNEWRNHSVHTEQTDWIFPSENKKTPLWPTNVWYDKIRPTLVERNLAWVNYQVLRRSAASLMNQLGVDGKIVADQLGHTLDVSQNVYTQSGIKRQRHAVDVLDAAVRKNAKNSQACKKTAKKQRPSI